MSTKGKGRGIVKPVVDFNKCEAKGPCSGLPVRRI